MSCQYPRRNFIRQSLVLSSVVPAVLSYEEKALQAQEQATAPAPSPAANSEQVPFGFIGKLKVGRLICGGNLISGYAHGRDLIYLSHWLRKYFTDDKIMETWSLCELQGINTMILFPADTRAAAIYEKYRARGGKIQYLAQISPDEKDLKTPVKQAKDAGASGAFLVGNMGDEWIRSGAVARVGELVALIKEHGMVAGIAGHEVRVPKTIEEAGVEPDFYVKTLHSTQYWSSRRPDQNKEVIDNYDADNYWCMNPEETIAYMRTVKRPWIAYKVLAAGAIHPRAGFRFAFENGADFAAVGMFDFQIAEDVKVANQVLPYLQNRQRPWFT